MAAVAIPNLTRLGVFDKPDELPPFVRRGGRRDGAPENTEISVIKTHLTLGSQRTQDDRTPYVVDVTGNGRNSAISRGMSSKRFLGVAAAAI
jgi:hypothetical protein